jgi:FkbM family methyltransferase
MGITTADVEAAIRLLLDREPADAAEAASVAALCPDRASLRRHLLALEEFERLHPDLALASAQSTVIVPLEDGVRIVVDLADHAIGVPIAHRAFELNELDFVRRTVRSGWHVVDGGAHAGLYALTMANLVGMSGSVHAFEPVADHAAWLEQGVRESAVQAVVHVVQAALSDARGRAEIVRAHRSFNPGAARLRGAGELPSSSSRLDPVATVALDDEELPGPVSFIRLDVEGAEGLALAGATRLLRRDRPIVLAEVHVDLLPIVSGIEPQVLFDRMRALGYTPYALGAGIVGAELTAAPSGGVMSMVFVP